MLGDCRLQLGAYTARQGAGTEADVMLAAQPGAGAVLHLQRTALTPQALVELVQFDVQQGVQPLRVDALEHQNAVEAIEPFRFEALVQHLLQQRSLASRRQPRAKRSR